MNTAGAAAIKGEWEGNPNQNEKAGSHIIQLSGIEIPEGQILRVLTGWVFNCVLFRLHSFSKRYFLAFQLDGKLIG